MGLFDKLFKKTEVKCKVCDEIIHSDFLANQPPSALRNYTCSYCKQISATKPVLDNLEESLETRFIEDKVFRERLALFFPEGTEYIHDEIIRAVGKELITNGNFENTNKIIKNKKRNLLDLLENLYFFLHISGSYF